MEAERSGFSYETAPVQGWGPSLARYAVFFLFLAGLLEIGILLGKERFDPGTLFLAIIALSSAVAGHFRRVGTPVLAVAGGVATVFALMRFDRDNSLEGPLFMAAVWAWIDYMAALILALLAIVAVRRDAAPRSRP